MDKRTPLGMWILARYYGMGNNEMAVAYWNPGNRKYEIQVKNELVQADTFLDLHIEVQKIRPDFEAIDYDAGRAIRQSAISRQIKGMS